MSGDIHDQGDSDLPAKLSSLARRALLAHGYTRLDQLTGVSEAEVTGWHGVGPKTLDQLRAALAARGLAFAAGQPDERTSAAPTSDTRR